MTMNNDSMPFIKVCGQTHTATVDCSIAYGARYVGFIFHRDSPRCISPEAAASINTANVGRVGVFVNQNAGEILSVMKQARLDLVQLHGAQSIEDAKLIGPDRIIRVLWPEEAESAESLQAEIDAWAPYCAFYLLDAGHIGHGGSGRNLNTAALKSLRFPHPWILAGGLSAANIGEVLSELHPNGLDLNSGIETAPGIKQPSKMLAAFSAVSRACNVF